MHSKGWVLLRARDASVRERIALAMERACANDKIGYSQGTRNTLYNDVKAFGFDPARTTKNVNTDCSALVRVCVNFAGIAVGDFTTSNEASVLVAAGGFERITDDKHCKREDYLLRGGILVTRTKGHTVVVLSNGALATEEVPVETGNLLVASGTWNLRTGPGTQYGAVKTVHGGDRLAQVDPDGWIPVNIGGDVLWISPKAIMEG